MRKMVCIMATTLLAMTYNLNAQGLLTGGLNKVKQTISNNKTKDANDSSSSTEDQAKSAKSSKDFEMGKITF